MTPRISSSCLRLVDIVGGVTPQASAARPKCRSLAKASRSSSLSIKSKTFRYIRQRSLAFYIALFQNAIDRVSLSQHETALLILQPIPNLIGAWQVADRERR